MPNSHLLTDNFDAVLGRERSSAVELWHVDQIIGWDNSNTVKQVYGALPYGGNTNIPHPDSELNGATLREYHIQRRWPDGSIGPGNEQYWNALVAVYFDTPNYGPSRYGRQGGYVRQFTERINVPCWRNIDAGGFTFWSLSLHSIQRVRQRRFITRYVPTTNVTGPRVDSIQNYTGFVFFLPFGSVPYLFMGATIDDLNNGLTRVVYTFETTGRIKAIGPNSRFGVAVPELGPLDEYVYPDQSGSGTPPTIEKLSWQDVYQTEDVFDIPFFQQ